MTNRCRGPRVDAGTENAYVNTDLSPMGSSSLVFPPREDRHLSACTRTASHSNDRFLASTIFGLEFNGLALCGAVFLSKPESTPESTLIRGHGMFREYPIVQHFRILPMVLSNQFQTSRSLSRR